MKSKIKIVGLDPSLRNWGIAIGSASLVSGELTVNELKTVTTKAKPKGNSGKTSTWDIETAKILHTEVADAISDADIVCVEVPYGSQDVKAAVGRGICLGVLGSLFDDRFILVTPQSVKKIVGAKDASKKECVQWATAKHPEAPWPMWLGKVSVGKAEHSADALIAIYAAAQTKEFQSIIKEHRHANQEKDSA